MHKYILITQILSHDNKPFERDTSLSSYQWKKKTKQMIIDLTQMKLYVVSIQSSISFRHDWLMAKRREEWRCGEDHVYIKAK